MSESTQSAEGQSDILIYRTEDGRTRLSVRMEDETVWLTQAMLADLYQTTPQNITLHIKAIYEDGELVEAATCKDYLQVRQEGGRQVQRQLKHYNLDMILAVGYRVRSPHGVQFRQWATERLREYIVKGFTLDDERLKRVDRRADADKPNMGLTAWSGSRVLKRDVGTAKNYLSAGEIDTLNRITVMFLDQAEFRAQRRRDIRIRDWEAALDKFLADTELPVLDHAGAVSHQDALEWAHAQYDAFAERRRLEAETRAEARYIEDLNSTAKTIENQSPPGKPPKPRKPRKSKG